MQFVLVADNLQREEAKDIGNYDAHNHAGDDVFTVFQIVFWGFHTAMVEADYFLICSTPRMHSPVRRMLDTILSTIT
jgi:hypothetical protein